MEKKPIRTFRDLVAWQKGMDLARELYRTTMKMPAEEKFGLTNQMRRAAVSVPSNIAEGYARQSLVDYIRFLKTARGSLAELSTQVKLALTMKLMPGSPALVPMLEEEDRVLQGLIASLQKKL